MPNIPQPVVYDRTREVYVFMLNHSKRRKEILQYFIKYWSDPKIAVFSSNVSEISKIRTIDNYIKRVKQTFLNFEHEVETERGRTLARMDYLFKETIKAQDYRGALAVLRELNEMLGHKSAQKHDIMSDGKALAPLQITVQSEETKKALENLFNKPNPEE